MSAPHVDRVTAVAAELGRLARRIDDLGAELSAATAELGAPPPVAQAPTREWTPLEGPDGWVPPADEPAWAPPPEPVPAPPKRASLSGARVLAWTGGGVTLLGVVLLLALAAARGWFGPPARVGAGAALGLALVALGARLHRRPTARTGALAVAGTGVATLYLVVAAATALYGYLGVPAGLLLALLVAAAGLGLADRWGAALLGQGAVVGAAVLAPVVTGRPSPLLVALVLVLQAAAAVVALRRGWPALALAAALWPVLYGVAVAFVDRPADRGGATLAVTAVLLLDLAAAVWTDRTGRRGAALLLGAAPLPLLVFAGAVDGWGGAALALIAAVLLLTVHALPGGRVPRLVAFAAGAVALFEAGTLAVDGDLRAGVLLAQAVLLLVLVRTRAALAVAGASALLSAVLAAKTGVPLTALASYPARLGWPAVALSVLLLVTCVAALAAARRVGLVDALGAPVGLVALYGGTGLVLALALLAAPSRTGFVAGHAVVTVTWTLVALALLARGIRRPALRAAGLVLAGAAVGKLFLFDLVALDGLARAGAFLVAGLLLLAAGARYARLVAEAAPA